MQDLTTEEVASAVIELGLIDPAEDAGRMAGNRLS